MNVAGICRKVTNDHIHLSTSPAEERHHHVAAENLS